MNPIRVYSPEEAPDYPTLWVVTDRDKFTPPFGEVIHIERRE